MGASTPNSACSKLLGSGAHATRLMIELERCDRKARRNDALFGTVLLALFALLLVLYIY